MPARTNQFQRLVYEIERQLAPLGAVVEESAMLPERLSHELRMFSFNGVAHNAGEPHEFYLSFNQVILSSSPDGFQGKFFVVA